MKSDRLIWHKGKIIPHTEAMINVLSPTSQFGANVFEGMRFYWNGDDELNGFRIDEHLNRLIRSVKMIGFKDKYTFQQLKDFLLETIRKNNFREDIAVRQTIYLDGFGSWFDSEPTEMFIAPIPKGRYKENTSRGVSCCISSWERINDNSLSPKIKVGANYINSRAGQLEAVRNGYDSALFLNNHGKVSEGPGSCVFIVRDGILITPPITASILESITRATIIQVASESLKIPVVERDVDRTEMYIADEVFLCGTAVEIMHVNSVDRVTINQGQKGPITKNIEAVLFEIFRGASENYNHWLTPV